jgi:hypothetical protein
MAASRDRRPAEYVPRTCSWRLALQAEHSLGLRESITRRYAELARSLDEQLGLEPARETRLLCRPADLHRYRRPQG